MKEQFAARDLPDLKLCFPSSGRVCSGCSKMLMQAHEEILSGKIVVRFVEDDTHHKLLAKQRFTLEKGVQICSAEEAATHTGDGMLPVGSINAGRKSQYQRQKRSGDKPVSSTSISN